MLKRKRWKRMLAILLTVMMYVQLVPMDGLGVVKAAETSGKFMYTLINDGQEVEINLYQGSAASVTVPGEIEGKKVTSIGDNAFSWFGYITSITLPEGLTSIGTNAFLYCSGLSSIKIPKSVTNIGVGAFQLCSGLSSIEIPEGVTDIKYSAFAGCSSLSSVTIPESVTSIEGSAFLCCSSLSSITIPESVTSIGNSAFDLCANNLTIYVKAGSYAEIWAKKQGYKTADIGSQNSNNKVTIPKVAKVTKFKATAKKKGFTLSWKKVSGANGYELQLSTRKDFVGAKTYTINKNKAKYTISKLKGKKKYYIRIRAYKNYKGAHGEKKKAYGTYVSVNKKTK